MQESIHAIIGDYQSFFKEIHVNLTSAGIDIANMPIVQLLYRTATLTEYDHIRDSLKLHCREFVETDFNGRPISILILSTPLELGDGFTVNMIELAAPRATHMYPSGIESIGVFVGKDLSKFIIKYKKVLSGVKDHGLHCKPGFKTFENGKTVKFYDVTLKEIVLLEGWRFEQLDEADDSSTNKMVHLINAWWSYFYAHEDWRALVKGTEPKQTGCGPVYELANPIDRPNESFAIANVRVGKVFEPHYHANEETEVYFVLEGNGIVVVGGEEQRIEKYSVVVISPNTAHYVIPESDIVLGVINTPPFNPKNNISLSKSDTSVGFDRKQFEMLTNGE